MANDTNDIRVMLETRPKGKKVIAVATGACWTFFDGVVEAEHLLRQRAATLVR